MDIGQRFKKIREDLGFTQDAMAKFLDCTSRSVKSYESGTLPSNEILCKLAKAGIDTTWLLAGMSNDQTLLIFIMLSFPQAAEVLSGRKYRYPDLCS